MTTINTVFKAHLLMIAHTVCLHCKTNCNWHDQHVNLRSRIEKEEISERGGRYFDEV